MNNATTQREKVNLTLPTFQGMAQQGTGNVKQTFPYPGNAAQARSRKIKRGTWRRTLIHALEKRLRERERENYFGGARPPNLLIIAPCGLTSSYLDPCPFCSQLGGRTLTPSVHAPCMYMQRQKNISQQTSKEINGRKSMLETS